MLNIFKKSDKKSKLQNFSANVEKLNATELKQVMGGTVNYNASKSNTLGGTNPNNPNGNNLGGSGLPGSNQ